MKGQMHPLKAVKVTAVIFLPGDRSVGIPDGEIRLDFGSWHGYGSFFSAHADGGLRQEYRKVLEAFGKLHEDCGPCRVIFGDECWECGSEIYDVHMSQGDVRKQCRNVKCITNQPEGGD